MADNQTEKQKVQEFAYRQAGTWTDRAFQE